MLSLTTRWMPHAAAVTSRPNGRGMGGVGVEPHAASQEELGVEVAEKEVGIGHCGLAAAEVVAGGARIGPRAVWTDLEQVHAIHARD